MQSYTLSKSLLLITLYITFSALLIMQYKSPHHQLTLADAVSAITIKPNMSFDFFHPIENPVAIDTNNTSIWEDIGNHLKLNDETNSPRVQAQIRDILANKAEFNKSLNASADYIYYIYSQIKARQLPAELALIPIIESDYNPYDHNKAGANGLWQFMPGSARGFGIKITNGYDGRRNIINSTNAALNYYTELNKEFHGDWYLSIAAYNCGDDGVKAAIRRAKSNDFWQLNVPAETKAYVPRLLAIAEIIKHPQQYGIQLPKITNKPFFKLAPITHSITLSAYAKSNNVDLKTLQALNPEYKNTKVMTNVSKYILVPVTANKSV